MIARVATEDDVVRAVTFARANRVLLAVKGGGHNIAGKALVDGGLVVDFARMKRVTVDPAARTARVEPGATLADVDRATQQHGLLVPTGVNSTTGIAGLTLGGGFGWTTRKFGLTIDNLRSARARDGRRRALLQWTGTNNPDLFWAIRGGGGNFGIVTEFEFDLHPVGPEVFAGLVVHPFADFANIVKSYERALASGARRAHVLGRAAQGAAAAVPAGGVARPRGRGARDVLHRRRSRRPRRRPRRSAASAGRSPTSSAPLRSRPGSRRSIRCSRPGARNYWKSHDVASFNDASIEIIRNAIAALADRANARCSSGTSAARRRASRRTRPRGRIARRTSP